VGLRCRPGELGGDPAWGWHSEDEKGQTANDIKKISAHIKDTAIL